MAQQRSSGNTQQSEQTVRSAPAFRGTLGSAQVLYTTLRGISNGKKDQHATCELDAQGLQFVVTDKSLAAQGLANLSSKLFEVWDLCGNGSLRFRVNLTVLLQCLGILGKELTDTMLKLSYHDDEECFNLHLVEGRVVTECKIRTLFDELRADGPVEIDNDDHASMDDDDNDDDGDNDDGDDAVRRSLRAGARGARADFQADFRSAATVNRMVVKSAQLRDAFAELGELTGAATVAVLMSPKKPFFRLSADGQLASCSVDFPQGDESFSSMKCEEHMVRTYRASLLQLAGRALPFADKTFVRMNKHGTLGLQHLIQQSDGVKSYVEFYVLSDAGDASHLDQDHDNGEDEHGGLTHPYDDANSAGEQLASPADSDHGFEAPTEAADPSQASAFSSTHSIY
ncbi:Cell cycle checkpoint protein RAD1 [Hondaea fermentalgiana]|uniref:Cell cycle checkpoint protein RAD1 n=1 Tax=Hondaea fermentalgiana TaxID=2315210 RepID=A0A2R5GKX8_9STRA|nr:Cell cycle checkpoint protein RAD1 [Hondaea fermentalgiana]|eukprot:GBG31537.1 Cell cycle checkpoint protein RAD1 [Hondaea fermentalgiana]